MIKNLKILAIVIPLLSLTTITHAGEYEGMIAEVWVNDVSNDNVGWIKLENTITNATCANGNFLMLDLSKESMKFALTLALTAYTTKNTVKLGDVGPCSGSGYGWLKYIAVK